MSIELFHLKWYWEFDHIYWFFSDRSSHGFFPLLK